MAVEGVLNEQTRALIADPDSANLYWALTELASQPIDLSQAFSYESQFWEFTIHNLRGLDQRPLNPHDALELLKKIYESGGANGWNPPPVPWGPEHELAALSAALTIEPQARAYLVEHGCTSAEVDALPLLQRALLYRWRQFAEARDNYFKWTLLPDDESGQRMSRLEAQDLLVTKSDTGAPFSEFLPAEAQVYTARLRHQRELNLLRAVEALRMHAAQHGAWPQSLADVTVVPVPPDPMTRKPFEYSVAAGMATLSASPTKPANPGLPAVRYELTLVRKANPAK
jgi:hypothetical protein